MHSVVPNENSLEKKFDVYHYLLLPLVVNMATGFKAIKKV